MVVLIAGPLLGVRSGHVSSQGEVLAGLLQEAGNDVVTASSVVNHVGRLVDTAARLVRHRSALGAVVVLVFSGRGFAIAEATASLSRLFGLPVVLWLHGGNLPVFCRRHPTRARRLFRMAQRIVAPSPFLAMELSWLDGRIEEIPNLLPLGRRYPERRRDVVEPRLLWMRSFSKDYRPEAAIDVLHLVRAQGVDATLTMAGQKGNRIAAVRQRAAELDIADAVNLPGFLDEKSKLRAFTTHDIFLATNRVDNTPVSLLEAAAAGLVVVAMAVGGIPYVFTSGHDALLVPDGDVIAMADDVVALVRNHIAAGPISTNAIKLSRANQPDSVEARWSSLLADVATGVA